MHVRWQQAAGAFVWVRGVALAAYPGMRWVATLRSGDRGVLPPTDVTCVLGTNDARSSFQMEEQRCTGNPSWYTWAEGCLTPAAWAVLSYRVAHRLWMVGLPSLALAVSLPARISSGADIHPQAVIGRRFRLAHGFGVVIGATAEIGDDCVLLQGVTLGVRHVGQSEPPGVRVHPRLGNLVRVGAGAVLLGSITVGDGVQIGANAVVLADIPAGATAVGIPARVICRGSAAAFAGTDRWLDEVWDASDLGAPQFIGGWSGTASVVTPPTSGGHHRPA